MLRGAQEAATGQARLMSTIVDSMSEGLTVVDEQGRVLLRNPAVRDLWAASSAGTGQLGQPGFYGLFHLDGTPIDRGGDAAPPGHRRRATCATWTCSCATPACPTAASCGSARPRCPASATGTGTR